MGKATILSGGVAGSYQIKIDYGQATKTARLAAITARQAELTPLIAAALAALNAQKALDAPLATAVDTAITTYVAAARNVPATQQAETAALAAWQAAQMAAADTTGLLPVEVDALNAAVAAAAVAYNAAKAATTAAQAAYKKALADHSTALVKLAEALRKQAPLQLAWQILIDEQTQLGKDQTYWLNQTLEETRQAWCADLTEDATGSVATVDIPGESKLVIIAPNAPAPLAAHGALAAREVQSAAQVFFNAAVLPGWQKFKPTFRRGTITALNTALDTASVTLETADKSSAQKLAINQAASLTAVPVKYMTCNAAAFEVGDKCVVQFKNQNWQEPEVVGFVDNPKPCQQIVSGVIRGGTLSDLPIPPGSPPGTLAKKTLSVFKPTANCWQYPLKSNPAKSPSTYNDEPLLGTAGTQYTTLAASQYSGRMAKAAQIIMGMGLVVAYDYRWACCHGITLAADGKPWLVEISAAEGVLAMLLEVGAVRPTTPIEAAAQARALFGGIPKNIPMPSGTALATAISAGKVLRLLTAAGMAAVFGKSAFSSAMGWSFNDAGSEAHNTCFTRSGGYAVGYHYKLDIAIGTSSSATLTQVSTGPFNYRQDTQCRFAFYDPGTNQMIDAPDSHYDAAGTAATGCTAPLFVCHQNNALEVVYYTHGPEIADVNEVTDYVENGVYLTTINQILPQRGYHSMTSTRWPGQGHSTRTLTVNNITISGGFEGYVWNGALGAYGSWVYVLPTVHYFEVRSEHELNAPVASGLWSGESRDSYTLYQTHATEYSSASQSFVGGYAPTSTVVAQNSAGTVPAPTPAYGDAGSAYDVSDDSYSTFTLIQGTRPGGVGPIYPDPPQMDLITPRATVHSISLTGIPGGTNWLDPVRACGTANFKTLTNAFGPGDPVRVPLLSDLTKGTLIGTEFAPDTSPATARYCFVGYL